jgi:hypothetical protein
MSSWATDLSFWAIAQNLRVIDLRCNKLSYKRISFFYPEEKLK